jgi:hypothetical protein
MRIWIVNNSGSMNIRDRCQLSTSLSSEIVSTRNACSRWNELKDTVFYHARLATSLKAPTIFHIASSYPNVNAEYHIASEGSFDKGSVQQDLHHMETRLESNEPIGRTVLIEAISKILPHILSIKKSLRTSGQFVTLILATDGIPSDEDGNMGPNQIDLFIHTLRILDNLPVVLIIRLSTDDEQVKNVSLYFV